jgi:putative transposase
MSRPLRIEFPGACYHVTSRGDRRELIYANEQDRAAFLSVLQEGLQRFEASLLAYCLMGNHYHLVLLTAQANLSRLMRHLNGVYTQDFNRRHGLVGHLFQGRFKAVLVDSDAYLMTLCRYVECNPVRAGLVPQAGDWAWSSYRAHAGLAEPLQGLDVQRLHDFMLQRACRTASDHAHAAQRYADAVQSGAHERLWEDGLRQQVYLGDEDFVMRMQALADRRALAARDVPRSQRATTRSLQDWLATSPTREAALWGAYRESGLTMTAMAAELGLSVSRVSRLLRAEEQRRMAARMDAPTRLPKTLAGKSQTIQTAKKAKGKT